MLPRSTRSGHSVLAEAPARATKTWASPAGFRWNPTDERIAGQAPASSESTEKYGRAAGQTGAANNSKPNRAPRIGS
jgi:hypothetical protein